jgi:hypothetical protein
MNIYYSSQRVEDYQCGLKKIEKGNRMKANEIHKSGFKSEFGNWILD